MGSECLRLINLPCFKKYVSPTIIIRPLVTMVLTMIVLYIAFINMYNVIEHSDE